MPHLAGAEQAGRGKARVGCNTSAFPPKLAQISSEGSGGAGLALGAPARHLPEVSTVRSFHRVGGGALKSEVTATEEP